MRQPRLPTPQRVDPAERGYLRFLNLYTARYHKLLKHEIDIWLPELIETVDKETPPDLRVDSEPPRSASIAVINQDGCILMGRRRDSGKWTLPGGHIDQYESPEEGGIRELQEETGLKAFSLEPLGSYLLQRPSGPIEVSAFMHTTGRRSTTERLDPDFEVDKWVWVELPLKPEVYSDLHHNPNVTLDALGLLPSRVDRMDARNVEKTVRDLFGRVQSKLMDLFPDSLLKRWATSMVGHVNDISKRNTKGSAKAVGLEIEPLIKDKKLNPFFQNVIDENVGLIRSIPLKRIETFKNSLVSMITADQSHKAIREMIQEEFGKDKSSAALIARDQTNKLNGRLQQYRQQQLGGSRYVWRTMGDNAVREMHKKLNGKVFSWDKPPVVNSKGDKLHPGQDFQCRCYPEMVFSDILD